MPLRSLAMRSLIQFLSVIGVHSVGLSLNAEQCLDPSNGLPANNPLQLVNPDKNLTVPALPAGGSDYSYASNNALVAVPLKCSEKYKNSIKKHTVLPDRDSASGDGYWYFFISDLEGGYGTLAKMTDCAAGIAIEAHGSGGPGWSAVQFSIWFAKMGFIAIIPNSMSMPTAKGLKGKTPLKKIEDITTDNYCGEFSAFDGGCESFGDASPYCYSTKDENILNDPDNYRLYVEGVYQIRKRELDHFVSSNKNLLDVDAYKRVYLVGNSEGGMVASRYSHTGLDTHLSGRIITAWSCNYNYYMSCSDNAKICEDKCDKKVPIMNIIGELDSYFGNIPTSKARIVSDTAGGYGGPITGNCHSQFSAQGFTKSTTVVIKGAYHGPNYDDDNRVRSLFADFLAYDGEYDDTWKSLATSTGCTLESGVFECEQEQTNITCKTIDGKYQENPNNEFSPYSTYFAEPESFATVAHSYPSLALLILGAFVVKSVS